MLTTHLCKAPPGRQGRIMSSLPELRLLVAMIVLGWGVSPLAGHEPKLAMPASLHSPAGLVWMDGPPSLPPGAKMAVLEGDPTRPGPFVFRVKVPDGYKIPPHTHPKPERVTVISGSFHLGMGDRFDPKKAVQLPAGT